MADFIALLKAQPDCFRNSRFILGNPWKDEPYGYCCTDGKRAFLAINNGVWKDSTLTLQLNSAWGLPDGQRWDLYRWWPNPAKLGDTHSSQVKIAVRPFDIVLLEVVPAGEPPTLGRKFESQAMPTSFAEQSRELPITVAKPGESTKSDAARWTSLEPAEFRSTGGAKLTKQSDGSLLASGENPPQDSYIIMANAPSGAITAIRLETLPDDSLPHQGPGRAVNGNFTLAEFTMTAGDQPVRIARAGADFAQASFGGWPAEAAIDGKPQTGWGIDPAEGMRHVAVFELTQPLVCAPGTALEFRLDHAGRQHSIGRLRLSATSAKPPIPMPASETQFLVSGTLPPTTTGGLLAVSDAFFHQSIPYWTRNCKTGFTIAGTLAGKPAAFEPVVNNGMYSAPWQTWRLAVPPSDVPQPFELRLTTSLPGSVDHRFSAHFVPQNDKQTSNP
jgi:hypothetical protein